MDKKYQKIAATVLGFLAVFLIVGLPYLVSAQNVITPKVGVFAEETWYQVLMQFVISGFGSLVAMIGWSLDYSIQNFILGFGDKYQHSGLGDTINALWGIVRDIFNLTFIFGLIFIGFKMILDAGDSHARHTLVSLIGAALLVNFSLFITKFIVDFSDLAAYKIYEAFKSSTAGGVSISLAFANLMGMSSLFNDGALATAGPGNSIIYLLGSLLVLLVLAYVYLAGAILIAIRFVVLTIYLVFSPVMFLGWVFPSMHGRSEEYWKGFLGQAFFAPAFLFMLYLSYRVMSTYTNNIQRYIFDGNGGYFAKPHFYQADSLIPFFILTVTFLIASMVVAKSMGAVGATSVIKIGKDMQKRGQQALGAAAGGATFGMAARAGRSTVGYSASKLSNSEFMKTYAPKFGRLGQGFSNAVDNVADSSFDARKIGGLGKSMGIGDGKKGGFTTRQKETKEADEKFNKKMGNREADKYDKGIEDSKTKARLEEVSASLRESEKEASDQLAMHAAIDKEVADKKAEFKIKQQETDSEIDPDIADKKAQIETIQRRITPTTDPAAVAQNNERIRLLKEAIQKQEDRRQALAVASKGELQKLEDKRQALSKDSKVGKTTKELKDSQERIKNAQNTVELQKIGTAKLKGTLEELEDKYDKSANEFERNQINEDIKKAKANYEKVKKMWSAREEYSRQLDYVHATEQWQKVQRGITTVGIAGAATLLTGGLGGIAIGAAGGVVGGVAGDWIARGNKFQNKQTSGAMRKEYGENGLKRRKHSHEEHAIKKAAALLGGGDDHEEKLKDEPKADAPTTEPAHGPSPTIAPVPGGGGH